MLNKAKFLKVVAEPRHWEDAEINGQDDSEGKMPMRVGNEWVLTIELATGKIIGWPNGVKASVWYKVGNQGKYYLQDESGREIAKWKWGGVPTSLLNQSGSGSDYINLQINKTGKINRWSQQTLSPAEWSMI